MQSVITIVHILAAVGLIGLVLIQHGRGADAGAAFGSGGAGTVFGARGPASFLTRATAVLAVVFFATSLSLAYLSGKNVERRSITERVGPVEQAPAPADGPIDVPRPETGESTPGDAEAEGSDDLPPGSSDGTGGQ